MVKAFSRNFVRSVLILMVFFSFTPKSWSGSGIECHNNRIGVGFPNEEETCLAIKKQMENMQENQKIINDYKDTLHDVVPQSYPPVMTCYVPYSRGLGKFWINRKLIESSDIHALTIERRWICGESSPPPKNFATDWQFLSQEEFDQFMKKNSSKYQ